MGARSLLIDDACEADRLDGAKLGAFEGARDDPGRLGTGEAAALAGWLRVVRNMESDKMLDREGSVGIGGDRLPEEKVRLSWSGKNSCHEEAGTARTKFYRLHPNTEVFLSWAENDNIASCAKRNSTNQCGLFSNSSNCLRHRGPSIDFMTLLAADFIRL